MSREKRLALLVSLTALLAFRCRRWCESDLLSSVRSPAGRYRAVEYFRDCEGATGPGSYEVSIIQSSDKLPKGAGNVLGLQPTRQGNARVKLRWLAEMNLKSPTKRPPGFSIAERAWTASRSDTSPSKITSNSQRRCHQGPNSALHRTWSRALPCP